MYTCSYVSANPCKDWFCTYMHACKGSLLSKHQCMYFGGRSVNTHTINSQKYTCRSIRGRIPALVCIYVFEYSCTGRQPATYSYPNTRCRSHLNMYMRSILLLDGMHAFLLVVSSARELDSRIISTAPEIPINLYVGRFLVRRNKEARPSSEGRGPASNEPEPETSQRVDSFGCEVRKNP